MIAVAWAAIGLLGATLALLATAVFQLSGKIDAIAARLEARIDHLEGRMDARFDSLNIGIDALTERLDVHLRDHREHRAG